MYNLDAPIARGSEALPGLGGKGHNPSEFVMSYRHCIKHPELETPGGACACGRGMLDKEARLEHPAACL